MVLTRRLAKAPVVGSSGDKSLVRQFVRAVVFGFYRPVISKCDLDSRSQLQGKEYAMLNKFYSHMKIHDETRHRPACFQVDLKSELLPLNDTSERDSTLEGNRPTVFSSRPRTTRCKTSALHPNTLFSDVSRNIVLNFNLNAYGHYAAKSKHNI